MTKKNNKIIWIISITLYLILGAIMITAVLWSKWIGVGYVIHTMIIQCRNTVRTLQAEQRIIEEAKDRAKK
jgi:hypothetical protein